MVTYVLIPGAGGRSWYWHQVAERLRDAGHDVVSPDLPAQDESARLYDYVTAVVDAVGGRSEELIVVGQSLGGFIAPLVCDRLPARLLVLVAAMIPRPGESAGEWWEATGQPQASAELAREQGRSVGGDFDPFDWFLHDLPEDVLRDSAQGAAEQAGGVFKDPWPLPSWPAVPTRVVAGRDDRFFPLRFMQRLSRDRLGIEPDVIDTGHLPALANADALTGVLEAYRPDLGIV